MQLKVLKAGFFMSLKVPNTVFFRMTRASFFVKLEFMNTRFFVKYEELKIHCNATFKGIRGSRGNRGRRV